MCNFLLQNRYFSFLNGSTIKWRKNNISTKKDAQKNCVTFYNKRDIFHYKKGYLTIKCWGNDISTKNNAQNNFIPCINHFSL